MSDVEVEKKSRFDEIALITNRGPELKTMADAWSIAQTYWNANMKPKGVKSAQELLIILIAGAELGFGPTWALRNIASFNGQAMLHTDGPISLVMRSGLMEWQRSGIEGQGDKRVAWFEVKRKGIADSVRRTFSVEDAKTAGLWGKVSRDGAPSTWKLYPERMLLMRARAYALRDLFSDVLGGIGIQEEFEGSASVVEPEEVTTGSQGLLNALTKPVEALPSESEDVTDVESEGSWEPSPEELEEIRAREVAEAGGLFGNES